MSKIRSIRLIVLIPITLLLLIVAFGLTGPHAQGQSRMVHGSDDNTAMVIRSAQHDTRIEILETFVRRLEESKFPERMARIEYQLESVGWFVKLIVGGIAALFADRIWGIISARR